MKIVSRRKILKPTRRFVVKFFHGDATLIDNHEGWEYVLKLDGYPVDPEWTDSEWWDFLVMKNGEFWEGNYANKKQTESSPA